MQTEVTLGHQEFQVPKMEGFLNLIFGYFGGWVSPYISRIHGATVDGSEIRQKPVDMVNITVFTGFYTSQVVQDFFHQQYVP